MKWKIRQEKDGDEDAIRDVVARAFAPMPFGDDHDQHIVGALRDAGALVLSLVAVSGKTIIGQVALSPANVGGGRYLCLGPLAVSPDHQRKGIGSALVQHALGVAQVYGRDGVVLQGNLNYYSRFGFKAYDGITYAGGGVDFIQFIAWGDPPAGEVTFHPAFNG